MPYPDIDLDQLWLRYWFDAWQHQAISWFNNNVDTVSAFLNVDIKLNINVSMLGMCAPTAFLIQILNFKLLIVFLIYAFAGNSYMFLLPSNKSNNWMVYLCVSKLGHRWSK